MSAELATLEQVKSMLRIDGDDFDSSLTLLIRSASIAILEYLKHPEDQSPPLVDLESSPPTIPEQIVFATIMLVGYWYRNPDGDPDKAFTPGFLPAPITALLAPWRIPTLA